MTALWLAMLLLGAGDVDQDLLLALYSGDDPWLTVVAVAITRLGDWWSVVAITIAAALWLVYQGERWAALTLLIVTFSGRALVILQKVYFARLRPEEHLRLVDVSSESFPSGHAANPSIAYVAIALLLFDDPRQRRIALAAAVLLSLLIGLTRPVLGVHWPSDVVAGWAFGFLWAGLVLTLMQRWRPARR